MIYKPEGEGKIVYHGTVDGIKEYGDVVQGRN